MRKALSFLLPGCCLLAVFLLAACDFGRHEEMVRQLELLSLHNQQDSVLTNDSLAQALADYFDRKGTPNQQMLAHYLLGRTHADRGEAPAALEAFLEAADHADTTLSECDFACLSRVYGQMSGVYYQENLMDDYIKSINHSVSYAWKAEDTLQALNETVHRIGAYNRLGRYEEVVPMFNDVYNLIVNKYGEKAAAPYCILPVNSLLELNELEKAKAYLDTYRWLSGYFDTEGRIEKGRETYYYYKGKYHLASQEYDSAEYSFRKELECGLDFTNQNMASRGLSLLYQQTNRLDSATKYAIYSYEMNDSVYSRMATKEVEQMTAIHNYSHYKKIAQQEKDKARKNRVEKYLITALLIALICVGVITFFIILKRKKAADEQYKKIVRELEKARKELQNLQSMSEETPNLMAIREKFDMQIKEKEMQIQILQSTLAQYHNSEYQTNHQAEDLLYESETFRQLQKKSIGCSALSDADWDEIEELVKEALPGFHFFLTSHSKDFNTVERRTCILLRLHIGMKDAGSLMGVSKSYISRISSEIMKRIFECKGSGKELKKSLEAIC